MLEKNEFQFNILKFKNFSISKFIYNCLTISSVFNHFSHLWPENESLEIHLMNDRNINNNYFNKSKREKFDYFILFYSIFYSIFVRILNQKVKNSIFVFDSFIRY